MGMTNKQFQGFIRLILALMEKSLKRNPEDEDLIILKETLQSMLEDGD